VQYTQLKQVVEIDNQITNLHKELSSLYAKRAVFLGTSGLVNLVNSSVSNASGKKHVPLHDPWTIQTYSYLAHAWMVHGIAIPAITEIDKKLARARKIIESLTETDTTIGLQMGVLLVPPIDLVSFPITPKIRLNQAHILLNDYVTGELLETASGKRKKTWQVLVAHLGGTGLDFGSAAQIQKYKKYLINGFDTRALGLRQYIALTLQINNIIDQNVWTILLGEQLANTTLVPSATFINGQYRFELDESNSILGEERFRPAIEVKG
jgi:hypothetical protein